MSEKLDSDALTSAIDKTQIELNDISKKKKTSKVTPEKQVTKIQKTKSKGRETTKKTTIKAKKTPEDFKDHALSNAINIFLDKLGGVDENTAKECQLGSSILYTLDFYLTNLPDHPMMYLLLSGGMFTFAVLSKHEMIPQLFPKKEETIETTKKEENPKLTKTEIGRTISDKQKIVLAKNETTLQERKKKELGINKQ